MRWEQLDKKRIDCRYGDKTLEVKTYLNDNEMRFMAQQWYKLDFLPLFMKYLRVDILQLPNLCTKLEYPEEFEL